MVTTDKTKSILSRIKIISNSSQHTGYSETIWLIPLILLAAFLRFYLLDDPKLNADEVDIVNRAVGIASSLETGNAFLYYPILRVWINIFGQSDFAVRLPAALIGVLTVPLVYKTGKLLLGQKIGLIGALLFSISMLHIYYSQQAHSYALFTFLSLFSFYFLWQAIHRQRRYDWLLFGLSVGLCINIHFYSFFMFLSEVIIGAILILTLTRSQQPVLNKKLWLNLIITLGLITLIIMPVLMAYALPQFLQVAGLIPKTGKRVAREGIVQFDISPELFAQTFRELNVWGLPDGISLQPNSHLLYDLYLIAAVIGIIYLAMKQPKTGAALLLWVVIPLLPAALLARAAGINFATRRLIFILPIYLIIMAIGFREVLAKLAALKFTSRPVGLALSLVLLVGVFGGLNLRAWQWYYYEDGKAGFYKWRDAALLLNKFVQPDDIVITSKGYFSNYYRGPKQTLLVAPETEVSLALFENAYTNHSSLWYVRQVDSERLEKIEPWLEEHDFLTFRFAEQEFFISYKRREVASEAVMMAEWVDILRQAQEILPRTDLYEALGNAYARGGNYPEAIAFYQQTLTDNPRNTDAHAGLAKVYQASGQYEAAMTHIEQAIAIAPSNLHIYRTLAYIYTAQGGTDQDFRKIYQRIEAIDPAAAHFARALLYVQQGHRALAIDEFQQIVQIYPNHQLVGQAQEWLNRL